MYNPAERITLIEAALGRQPLDLLLQDIQLVNVYTGQVEPASIGIKAGHIVSLNAEGLPAGQVFAGEGRFAMPGFIDSHVHLDSTLLTPENLSQLIVPHGTTMMLADPMESANVAGYEGLKALLHLIDELPYHILIEVSSRVPTAPGLETTGGELGLEAVKEILAWETSISLGELDPSKVLGLREEYLAKVGAAYRLGKIANGHAASLTGRELEAYVCAGLADDHECIDADDAFARLRLGMSVLARYGSAEHNLDLILKGWLDRKLDTRHIMFCTDDKHPNDILSEGHLDFMINRAIEMGVPPVQAIQMATINSAIHFRIDHLVGSLSPGRWADIVLAEDLQHIVPSHVFFKGRLVAQNGELIAGSLQSRYPHWFLDTVHVSRGKQAQDFILPAPGPTAIVHIIDLYPDQIINRRSRAGLSVINGNAVSDVAQDVLKLAVVERHGKNGNIGLSFTRGFGLKRGAIASSVAHDHHNIIVVGVNEIDMAVCVEAIEAMHGGLAVVEGGKLLGALELPVGGLMSVLPAGEVIRQLEDLNALVRQLGGTLPAPFNTLSFISLPTIPDLGLTDLGLVDVRQYKLISPFAE